MNESTHMKYASMIDFQSNTPRGSGDNIKHKNNVFFDDSRNRLIYNRKCWIAGATHAHDLLAVSLCRACSRCCIAPVSVCVCMNFPAVVLKRSRTFICMGDQSHVPQAGSSLLAGTGSSLLERIGPGFLRQSFALASNYNVGTGLLCLPIRELWRGHFR